jgi:hypothetical protein
MPPNNMSEAASSQFVVTATALNLRAQPRVRPGNKIAVLPNGQVIKKIGDAPDPDWWRVSTELRRQQLEGFVARRHLQSLAEVPAAVTAAAVTAVHMREGRPDIRRDRDGGRAFPIGEAGAPRRDAAAPDQRARQIVGIIDWLDVGQSARYLPKPPTTFCNIYAYDYCYLTGAYLPRVWWTGAALRELSAGRALPVQYGQTVREVNANGLLDWLEDFGDDFGWSPANGPTELQDAANAGEVCVIVAQRQDLNRSGHISVVAPENGGHRAQRVAQRVTRPLQSQAGAHNFRFGTGGRAWWQDNKFRDFGLWRHSHIAIRKARLAAGDVVGERLVD